MASSRRSRKAPGLLRADAVRQRLMEEIVTGVLAPGERLDEVGQANRLGVSRTPVREAFRHLTAMGMLINQPHRGVTVADPGPLVADLVEAAAAIGSECARLAATRLDDAMREQLRALTADAVAAGDLLDLVPRATGNHVLGELAGGLRCRLMAHWRRLAEGEEWRRQAAAAQSEVVEALIDGKGEAAATALSAYVRLALTDSPATPA